MKTSDWKVIVVEDEEDGVQMMSQILEHYKVKVFVAQDGLQCLTLLKSVRPTLIIMDLHMPGMDGWETLAAIRDDARTYDVPVVAITAYDSPEVQDEAYRVGFDGYFAKPVEVSSFMDSLQNIISTG